MKNTTIFCLLCMTIGFAAGWLAKPAKEATSPERTQSPTNHRTSRSSQPSISSDGLADRSSNRSKQRTRSTVRTYTLKDDIDAETAQAIEDSQKQQNEIVRKRFAGKFDMQIAAMVKELNLNAAQQKALRTFFDEQLKKIDISHLSDFSGATESDAIKQMAAAMRGDGLNEFMKQHLHQDQMKNLEALQQRKKNSEIESRALKNFAKLQQALDLSEEQKDKVYNVLFEDAETHLASQSDTDYVTSKMMSSMGIEMDLGEMDMSSLMSLQLEDEDTPTSRAEMIQKIKDSRQKQIDAKVARLAPILTENQQQLYRKNLENKGGMFQMMLMNSEENPKEESK